MLQMMEGRSDLDQSLKECLVRLIAFQPFAFPMLMSFEEFPIAIAAKAVCEISACPFKDHRFFIITAGGCALRIRTCGS